MLGDCENRGVEFAGTQCAKKVLFEFLTVIHALNLEGLSGLLHAKHNPTAGGIGKRADGLPYILRQFGLRGLDLEIFPFYVA